MKTLITLVFITLWSLSSFTQSNYQDDHVLVKLNWRYLDLKVIDDDRVESLPLGKLLNQEGIEIIQESGADFLLDNDCRKIFGFLKTTDTVSYGRTGNKVRIPTFWSWVNLTLDGEIDIANFCSRTLDYKPLVLAAHPNWSDITTFSIPNDSLFSEQNSLNSTTFPDAHIDLDSVWNITTGEPWVKVGVFDTGIDTSHPDLQVLTGKGFFEDATSGDIPWWGEPVSSHGTRVAGIIGAKRNNEIGIAGIAGGNGSDTAGASIIDMTILPSTGFDAPSVDMTAAALVDGARDVGTYYDWEPLYSEDYASFSQGFGLWVANHSYGFYINQVKKLEDEDSTGGGGVVVPFSTCFLCIEAYLFSNENNVTNVVSRGNIQDPEDDEAAEGDESLWPQTYPDHMIISVGGSSYDGNRWTQDNNSSNEGIWNSMIGRDIDLIAPATDSIVRSTQITYLEELFGSDDPISDYSTFAGTSSAAPHVTGTIALLLSYYNKPCYSNYNLANEDIEKLLEKSAVDVHAPGYDDESGHGRLNAFNLFDSLYRPHYQVVHPTSTSPISVNINIHDTVNFEGKPFIDYGPYNTEDLTDPQILFNAEYETILYKVEATYDFSSYVSAPNVELLDSWIRINTSTFATPQEDTINAASPPFEDFVKPFRLERFGEKISSTETTITLGGYLYHFFYSIDEGDTVDVWYPRDTSNFHFDYSIYLRDTVDGVNFDWPCDKEITLVDTTLGLTESVEPTIKVFPNPSSDQFHVTCISNDTEIIQYTVSDLSGRVVLERNNLNESSMTINSESFGNGVYLLDIYLSNGHSIVKRIVKQ